MMDRSNLSPEQFGTAEGPPVDEQPTPQYGYLSFLSVVWEASRAGPVAGVEPVVVRTDLIGAVLPSNDHPEVTYIELVTLGGAPLRAVAVYEKSSDILQLLRDLAEMAHEGSQGSPDSATTLRNNIAKPS